MGIRRLDRTTVDLFVRKLPKGVAKLMIKHEDKLLLAGGYCRALLMGGDVRDIDLFKSNEGKFPHKSLEAWTVKALEAVKRAEGYEVKKGKTYPARHGHVRESADKNITRSSPVAHTLQIKDKEGNEVGVPIQICRGFDFDTPRQLLESFDFTVCQICMYYDGPHYGWDAICTDEFWRDINTMTLTYNEHCRGVRVTSIARVHKYLSYGFKMNSEELRKYLDDSERVKKNKGKMGIDRGGFS